LVVDADLAELVDDDRGLVHGRVAQQVLEERRLPAAEESGDQADRELPREDVAPGCRHQTFISRTYSPPAKRSTVNTSPLSSTYTSLSWIEPALESFGAGGT